MLEYKLGILIARSYDASNAIQLNHVTTNIESLQLSVLAQTFTNGQSSLFAKIAASHAQMVECFTSCQE